MQLNNLSPLVKKRKRVGRGGKLGGTSGKGHKGQKARSGGYVRIGFEGGQMPLFRRLPKRGFNNFNFKDNFVIVNLEQIENGFDAGAIVNKEALVEKGIIKAHKGKKGLMLKVLGHGELSKKLTI
ncbi:MAG: 50S ribosomal protein L15, partial [Candidatus Dependentiae bacterium]|nr:50S ribosomal protein L15 [Candidatus Dependentiae bacterium]